MSYIKNNRGNYLKDLENLIKIKSFRDMETSSKHAPFGKNIQLVFNKVEEIATRLGFNVTVFDGYAMHIEYGNGKDIIGILGHLDIVPAFSEDWETDPYSLTIKNNILYGRGVNDNKGPVLATIYMLKDLQEAIDKSDKKVRIILGGAEETTWECMDHYFKFNEQPKYAFSPDGNFPIINGEKGILYYEASKAISEDSVIKNIASTKDNSKVCSHIQIIFQNNFDTSKLIHASFVKRQNDETIVTYIGKSSMGRNPHRGKNAIFDLIEDLKLLNDSFSKEIYEMLKKFKDFYGKDFDLKHFDSDMETTTMCLNYLTFNNGILNFAFDFRYPKGIEKNKIENRFELFSERFDLILNKTRDLKLLYVSKENDLIKSLQKAYKKVTHNEATLHSKGAASYARVLDNGVAFGPTFEGEIPNSHKENEKISILSLERAVDIYIETIKILLTK